jgi:hypothetical protein
VSGDALVSGNARVYGDALVSGNARVYGNAWVSGNAWVYGELKLKTGFYFEFLWKNEKVKKIKTDDGELLWK